MRTAVRLESSPGSPRLRSRARGERLELWTETVGSPPPVYGERWAAFGARTYRAFEPVRSKLAAAIVRDWRGPLPAPAERWLYLGAATGTTASHVADLLGPDGRLYAVERSPRPFARLLNVAERWPNLLPVLGDARDPIGYADRVPLVDGIYADVAQPDQVALVVENARLFLRDRAGMVVVALKTSSMGRTLGAPAHLRASEAALSAELELAPSVRLDPFYRSHYLIGGTRGRPQRADGPRPLPRRPGKEPGRPGRSLRYRRS